MSPSAGTVFVMSGDKFEISANPTCPTQSEGLHKLHAEFMQMKAASACNFWDGCVLGWRRQSLHLISPSKLQDKPAMSRELSLKTPLHSGDCYRLQCRKLNKPLNGMTAVGG